MICFRIIFLGENSIQMFKTKIFRDLRFLNIMRTTFRINPNISFRKYRFSFHKIHINYGPDLTRLPRHIKNKVP